MEWTEHQLNGPKKNEEGTEIKFRGELVQGYSVQGTKEVYRSCDGYKKNTKVACARG